MAQISDAAVFDHLLDLIDRIPKDWRIQMEAQGYYQWYRCRWCDWESEQITPENSPAECGNPDCPGKEIKSIFLAEDLVKAVTK